MNFNINTGTRYRWVLDAENCFLPGKVLKEEKDSSEIELGSNGTIKTFKNSELGPWILRHKELNMTFENMVSMTDVNEATILHNLRLRFHRDEIYTNIGSILVSLNPFKWMPHLYSSENIQKYLNKPPGEVAEPHVFEIAAAAYRNVSNEQTNQSIIISGESGAGKTEATKHCLKFFAEAAGASSAGMAEKLLSANPILEAFGNAKTVRNNNSSRFGKWMEVHFNGRAQICGSQIINYLLEKSRVAFQASAERNYHIFYMLALGATPEQRKRYSLTRPEDYTYTNRSSIVVDGLNDVKEYEELLSSFRLVEISEEEYEPLLRIVAGLLHLSNISFDAVDQDTSIMSSSPAVANALLTAANLLGVDSQQLRMSMEQKTIETRNERVKSPLSAEKATDARNSMAKALYGRMFDWLVNRVNEAMEGLLSQSANVIGVLDIFGFEIFEVNSFEQLCINYCNEKLQQHFNYHVFKAEERCYKAEEIDYAEVKFIDNQDVLDLIEKKPEGLLPRLDDECKVPRGSDMGYLDKINKIHADNPRLRKSSRRGGNDAEFGVNHYAGTVYYNISGFMEKNKDELLLNVREVLQASSLPLIRHLFSDAAVSAAQRVQASREGGAVSTPSKGGPGGAGAGASGSGAGAPGDKQTQSTQFRGQLDALMKTLNRTEPHYIRCVKPNQVKKGGIFDAPICLQQLRYAGVFEAVKIRQQGFPFRWSYEAFYKRYRGCSSQPSLRANPAPGSNFRELSKRLAEDLAPMAPEFLQPFQNIFKFGKTMVLYRADQHRVLEMIRDHTRVTSASAVQRVFRGHVARKFFARLAAVRLRVRAALQSDVLAEAEAALAEAFAQKFVVREAKALQQWAAELREAAAILQELERLFPLDPAEQQHYGAYEAVLARAQRHEALRPGLVSKHALLGKCARKFGSVKDRIETKGILAAGVEAGDKAVILKALQRAKELEGEWGDVLTPALRAAADDALQVIAVEDKTLDRLRTALSKGKITFHPVASTSNAGSGTSSTVVSTSSSQNRIDHHSVDSAVLSQAIDLARQATLRTKCSQNLLLSAIAIRDARTAVKMAYSMLDGSSGAPGGGAAAGPSSKSFGDVEAAAREIAALAARGALAPEARNEAAVLRAEVADRKAQGLLVAALQRGAASGKVGEVPLQSADDAGLLRIIDEVKKLMMGGSKEENEEEQKQKALKALMLSANPEGGDVNADAEVANEKDEEEKIEEFSPSTHALLVASEHIHKLRVAAKALDWTSLRRLVSEAQEAALPPLCIAEVATLKAEVENHFTIHFLSDALERCTVFGVIGSLECPSPELALNTLRERVRHAEDIGVRTLKAQTLLAHARIVKSARELFIHLKSASTSSSSAASTGVPSNVSGEQIVGLIGEYAASLGGVTAPPPAQISSQTVTTAVKTFLPLPDYVPLISLFELYAIYYEMEDLYSCQALAAAAVAGPIPGPVAAPSSSRAVVGAHAAQLAQAVTRARTRGCRSPRAQWSLELCSALLELRTAFYRTPQSDWEPVLRPLVAAVYALDSAAPSHPFHPEFSIIVTENNHRQIDFAADFRHSHHHLAAPPKRKSSAVSATGSSAGSAAAIEPVVQAVKESTADSSIIFSLPPAVQQELSIVTADLAVLHSLKELGSLLGTDGPSGELGCLDASTVKTRALALALEAARRAGAHLLSPLGASLCYSADVIIRMRNALRPVSGSLNTQLTRSGVEDAQAEQHSPPDWVAIEGVLKGVAKNNSRVASFHKLPCAGAPSIPCSLMSSPSIPVALSSAEASLQALLGMDVAASTSANSQISVTTGELHIPSITLSMPGLAEAVRVEAELEYRRVMDEMVHALGSDGCGGRVGALETRSISTAALARAIDAARALGPRTRRARHLLALSRLVWQLRTAVLEDDWNAVDALFLAGEKVLNPEPPVNVQRGQVHLEEIAAVPDSVAPEIALYRGEANARRCTRALREALGRGAATGAVGKILVASVDVTAIEAALKLVLEIGLLEKTETQPSPSSPSILSSAFGVEAPKSSEDFEDSTQKETASDSSSAGSKQVVLSYATQEISNLVATAIHVRAMRLALLASQWSRLGELLDVYFKAFDKHRGYTISSNSGSSFGVPAGPLDMEKEIEGDDFDDEGEGLRLPALQPIPPSLELFARSHTNSNIDFDAVLKGESGTALAPAGAKEVLSVPPISALSALLNRRVQLSDVYPPADIMAAAPAPEARAEALLLQLELDNRTIIFELSKACASGAPTGVPGRLDVGSVELGRLEWAIGFAVRAGVRSPDAARALLTARALLRVRRALCARDWDQLAVALNRTSSSANGFLLDICREELSLVQDELDNRIILGDVSAALSTGCVTGRPGHLLLSNVSTERLAQALETATQLGPKSPEAVQMVFTGRLILRLRQSLLAGDVAEASAALEAVSGKLLSAGAMAELRTIQDEVDNWAVLCLLGAATAAGAPTGLPGALDLSALSVAELESALARAEQLGVRTQEAANAFAGAALAYRLRLALLRDDWSGEEGSDGVEALLRAHARVASVCPAVKPEVDLLVAEVANRRVLLSLAKALASGGPTGGAGRLSTASIDSSLLDKAIADATTLPLVSNLSGTTPLSTTSSVTGALSEDATRLLTAAKLIRRLRAVLLSGNWQWVGSVLMEARSVKSVFPPVSLRELQLVQDELDNRAVVAQLQTALRLGPASGAVGALEEGSADPQPLEEAILFATKVGARSAEALHLLAAADVLRQLRAALRLNDWASIGYFLNKFDLSAFNTAGANDSDEKNARLPDAQIEALLRTIDPSLADIFAGTAAVTPLAPTFQDSTVASDSKGFSFSTPSKAHSGSAHSPNGTLSMGNSNNGVKIIPIAPFQDELTFIRLTLENHLLIRAATLSLVLPGRPAPLGHPAPASLPLATLDAAVALAVALGAHTPAARRCLVTCLIVRRLRGALLADDTSQLRHAIAEARREQASLLPAIQDELAFAQQSLEMRAVVATLNAILSGDTAKVQSLSQTQDKDLSQNPNDTDAQLLNAIAKIKINPADLGTTSTAIIAHSSSEIDSKEELEAGLDVEALEEALSAANRLGLASHPRTHVRSTVENAEHLRQRARAAQAALAEAVKAKDPAALLEGLSLAAAVNLNGPVVRKSKDLLARLQSLVSRSAAALREADAMEMEAILRQCKLLSDEGLWLYDSIAAGNNSGVKGGVSLLELEQDESFVSPQQLPVLGELHRVLSLPRDEFLRRELAAALQNFTEAKTKYPSGLNVPVNNHVSSSTALVSSGGRSATLGYLNGSNIVPSGADNKAPEFSEMSPIISPGTVIPSCTHLLPPTPLELAVLNATVSIKDTFFADSDLAANAKIAELFQSFGNDTRSSALVDALRQTRNIQDNVRGAKRRLDVATLLQSPLFPFSGGPKDKFQPLTGSRASTSPHSSSLSLTSGLPEMKGLNEELGVVVPPVGSPLTRQLALSNYARLKPPHLFSPRFAPTVTVHEAGMLRWQAEPPLHASLTLLQQPTSRRAAVRCFRAIQAAMGDRPLSGLLQHARDLLETGVEVPELRDEILVQIMKQLSDNPSPLSERRGWILLEACLSVFPPSDALENSLELMLRSAGARPLVLALHLTQLRGPCPASRLPSEADLELLFNRADIAVIETPSNAITIVNSGVSAPPKSVEASLFQKLTLDSFDDRNLSFTTSSNDVKSSSNTSKSGENERITAASAYANYMGGVKSTTPLSANTYANQFLASNQSVPSSSSDKDPFSVPGYGNGYGYSVTSVSPPGRKADTPVTNSAAQAYITPRRTGGNLFGDPSTFISLK